MSVDQNATLKNADKLLAEGKLTEATEEYVRLADHLYGEGFFAKASAIYRKAVKIQSDHEHSLFRLFDIALAQGMTVDAKTYMREVVRLRNQRSDIIGLAECLARLAKLQDEGAELRRTREQLGMPATPDPPATPQARVPPPPPVVEPVRVEPVPVEAPASEPAREEAQIEPEPVVTEALEPPMRADVEKDDGAKSIETVFGEIRSRAAHDRRAVLYDVAAALEQRGDCERALEIFMQVQSDGGAYRDVAERIERLRVLQQGSAGA